MPAAAQPRTPPPARQDAAQPADTYGTYDSHLPSSRLMGMLVEDESGAHLGRVQDLIVTLDSGVAPFVIVHYGGALGIGGTRVAVPLSDLKLSEDGKTLTLATSQEQFQSASPSPTGEWAAVANDRWTRRIDRYYGQPSAATMSRFERQETPAPDQGREPVRQPIDQPAKGATLLQNQPPAAAVPATPAEGDLKARATEIVSQELGPASAQNIQVSVDNGVVTLKGQVTNAAQKRTIDERIQALSGVQRVDDQITTTD